MFAVMRRHLAIVIAIVMAILITACSPTDNSAESTVSSTTATTSAATTTTLASTSTTERLDFAVSSPAFGEGESIPSEYTCDGEDVSPELQMVGLPPTTRSVAVVVSDPDAPLGTWYHWVEFDIPVAGDSLTLSRDSGIVGVPGVNSWNLEGYMGPCPPEGEEHRYVFTVYALGEDLGLPGGVDAIAVIDAAEASRLGSVEITGLYGR